MLALISPAKKMDFESEWDTSRFTQPRFMDDTQILADRAKGLSQGQIQSLMKLSDALGALNYDRYQRFSAPFTPANARPAVLAFLDLFLLPAATCHDPIPV